MPWMGKCVCVGVWGGICSLKYKYAITVRFMTPERVFRAMGEDAVDKKGDEDKFKSEMWGHWPNPLIWRRYWEGGKSVYFDLKGKTIYSELVPLVSHSRLGDMESEGCEEGEYRIPFGAWCAVHGLIPGLLGLIWVGVGLSHTPLETLTRHWWIWRIKNEVDTCIRAGYMIRPNDWPHPIYTMWGLG